MENEIFVTIPTGNPDDPYRRVTLQQMADVFSGIVWDLKSDMAAMRSELAKEPVVKIDEGSQEHPERTITVREAIDCLARNCVSLEERFSVIAKELHSTAMSARALMSGPTPPSEVN
jgi:hypothetical protein